VNAPKTVPARGYPADGREPQTFLRNVTTTNKPVRTPADLPKA
jgi:hypothetical protein